MDKRGLDISVHNDNVLSSDAAWQAIKDSQFNDFIILRRGYGVNATEDECYKEWYERARSIGITDISSYWFSYALSPEEAAYEAEQYAEMTKKDGLALTAVILDFEDNAKWQKAGYYITPKMANAHCKAFIDVLKKYGLNCAIYSGQYILTNIIDWQSLGCSVWNAAYSQEDQIRGWIFQYTDSQYIGRYGPFDANIMYG